MAKKEQIDEVNLEAEMFKTIKEALSSEKKRNVKTFTIRMDAESTAKLMAIAECLNKPHTAVLRLVGMQAVAGTYLALLEEFPALKRLYSANLKALEKD